MRFTVQFRKLVESSVMEWTPWTDICTYHDKATAEDSAATFHRINPTWEYRILPEPEKDTREHEETAST